jgi:hypothetical protein
MSLISRLVGSTLAAIAILVPAASLGQATDQGTVFFRTNVGSFKVLGVQARPAEGKFQVTFTGTMLVNRVSGSDPKITVAGKLRKEYEDSKHLQVAYHGTGTMTIEGKFSSLQWFGKNMSARWDGFGIARLVGEFDKELKTGEYWYVQNPADIRSWGTQLKEITNPPRPGDYIVIAKPRPGGG